MSRRAGTCAALLLLLLAHPAFAQRTPSASAGRAASGDVRAELAAVLLNSKRYAEAAREYQKLLQRSPGNDSYRWGLARALAWGKRPRDAERELRILKMNRPNDSEVDALLRSVRESLNPTSGQAAAWFAERRGYTPYRLALARALVREGNSSAAVPHYEALIAFDNSPPLRREAIDALITAGNFTRAAQLLRGTLARAYGDSAARHTLARLLVDTRQQDLALAQYDTLVAWYPSSAVLLERAQLNLARHDLDAAEADATASINARQNADAYMLLSSLNRGRGDLHQARVYLQRAAILSPDPRMYAEASAQLAREERPVSAFLPEWDEGSGWNGHSSIVHDNLGLTYTTIGARGVLRLPPRFTGSIDVELRRIAEPTSQFSNGITGAAFDGGLTYETGYGPLLVRLGARGGIANQANFTLPTFALAASAWVQAWGISFEHMRVPAYPTLLSVASVLVPDNGDVPLSERSTSLAAGGPVGIADLALYAQRANISDGNQRTTAQGVLRLPIAANVALLASGTSIRFSQRSTLYWDPMKYASVGGGIELFARQARGLSGALRALAGPARGVEEVRVSRTRTRQVESSALQFTGAGELSYRSEAGEVAAALGYGSGRAGDYRRFEATVYVRRQR